MGNKTPKVFFFLRGDIGLCLDYSELVLYIFCIECISKNKV